MLEQDWKLFKSGSDIRGVATPGPAGQAVNLTDEAVRRMAAGFLLWLSEKTGKPACEMKIAVGHDSRVSANRIQKAVVNAMLAAGARVLVCGLASTPSMFMVTVDWDCDGSVQITASHHPYYRNGLKFFTKQGGLDGCDIEAILEYAQDNKAPAYGKGEAEAVDYMSRYCEILRNKIKEGVQAEDYDHPLAGFHIVVDAGNGAGGFYASDVLAPLGADVSGSQFLEPDGMFPNHIPNPENEAAMASVCKATLRAKADLGVIFDT
ncbi:MAG TPA: phosphomannomutase/phosphoglucomutase, partial [Candidatus Caccousia avistercoris]|nr:phosphomannomutase/phosphoglucomutase [Candidatus Caccousia avistercoris]